MRMLLDIETLENGVGSDRFDMFSIIMGKFQRTFLTKFSQNFTKFLELVANVAYEMYTTTLKNREGVG